VVKDGCVKVPPVVLSNAADGAGYVPAMGDGLYVKRHPHLEFSDHEYTEYISLFDHATG